MKNKQHKLLIANRGEIAVRIIQASKDLGIHSVAVYADDDIHSLHVKLADEAWSLSGVTAKETYLDIDKIIAIAKKSQTTMIHPGYGFLSENANFAKILEENKIKFIPQLFYKIYPLPFGIQTFQVHLNYYNQNDFNNFKKFIELNSEKIITYDYARLKINNNFIHKIIRTMTKKILQIKRLNKNYELILVDDLSEGSASNLPKKLRQAYNHSDMGVYLKPLTNGIIEINNKFFQTSENRKKITEQKIVQMKEDAIKSIKGASIKIYIVSNIL